MKKKYAIYKNKVGLYAKLYVDTLEGCKNIIGGYLVKQEQLPIVVNPMGGRCSFYPVEDNFIEIIEVEGNEEPLTREQMFPKNSKEFKYGYISPEGDTYNTGYKGHYDAAYEICKELKYQTFRCERELENKGWIKITRSWNNGIFKKDIFVKDCFITKKQADTLFDLGLYDDIYVKLYIEMSQDNW